MRLDSKLERGSYTVNAELNEATVLVPQALKRVCLELTKLLGLSQYV